MNQKFNKGITLIALVITIIVLLILAGVTINMVLGDDGIIKQAQDAKQAQEKGEGRDEGAISLAEGAISRYSMGKYDASKNNGIATQNSTINGEKSSNNNPVIPKGFKVVNDETTNKPYDVNDGFIIEDEKGNQFVWVPVTNISSFNDVPRVITQYAWGGTGEEGDILNRTAILENEYENTEEGLLKQYTDEYNSMKESVKAYGGFYVGRYETTWTGTQVASVEATSTNQTFTGNTDLAAFGWKTINTGGEGGPGSEQEGTKATWYGLYKMQKELYKKNSNSSVVSGMIYGDQWDAMMNWMSDVKNDGTYAQYSEYYIYCAKGMGNEGSPIPTGTEDNYKVKNIYDLAGNYQEWTQDRCLRGGYDTAPDTFYPSHINGGDGWPSRVGGIGSRLQLYIK